MKVLIVGGAGYLGGIMVDLFQKNHDVTIYDNLFYEEKFLKPATFVCGDIRDTEKLFKEIVKNDVTIFLSAIVGDNACSAIPQVAKEVNLIAIKDIYKKLKGIKRHIIFPSSCSVYGAQSDILTEESKMQPLSLYAETKVHAEPYIEELGGCIFRLGTIYGLGDNYSRIRLDLVANVMTKNACKYGKINVNGGSQWRPIISAVDVATYFLHAAEKRVTGTYILSSENVQINSLASRIQSLIPCKIDHTDISDKDARNYRVDNSKAINKFNLPIINSLEFEVLRMKKIFEEQRIKNTESERYNNGNFIKKHKIL